MTEAARTGGARGRSDDGAAMKESTGPRGAQDTADAGSSGETRRKESNKEGRQLLAHVMRQRSRRRLTIGVVSSAPPPLHRSLLRHIVECRRAEIIG